MKIGLKADNFADIFQVIFIIYGFVHFVHTQFHN